MINTKVVRVKSSSRGFSVLRKADRETLESLCDFCAYRGMCDLDFEATIFGASITTCRQYQYPIDFPIPDGIATLERFNTLRMGPAWGGRVARGSVVGLTHKGEVIKYATVSKVITGPKNDILAKYARANHIAQSRKWTSDAPEKMHKFLRNCYGTGFFDNAKALTVICLINS